MNHVTKRREVLTLEEVARYLRLPKDTIVRQAAQRRYLRSPNRRYLALS